VIREHSAVTISNHTDSTWYVSSKHPQFVRPLHGKRRHPLRNTHHRQVLRSESLGRISESVGRQPSPEMGKAIFDGRLDEEDSDSCCDSSVRGSPFAGDASSHVRLIHRRPHSAPSPAYGRGPAVQPDVVGMDSRPNVVHAKAHAPAYTRNRVGIAPMQADAAQAASQARTPSV
jgi:hypothetical protein